MLIWSWWLVKLVIRGLALLYVKKDQNVFQSVVYALPDGSHCMPLCALFFTSKSQIISEIVYIFELAQDQSNSLGVVKQMHIIVAMGIFCENP